MALALPRCSSRLTALSPSGLPMVKAKPALVVASAWKPSCCSSRALPASQALAMMKAPGSSWSAANAFPFSFCEIMVPLSKELELLSWHSWAPECVSSKLQPFTVEAQPARRHFETPPDRPSIGPGSGEARSECSIILLALARLPDQRHDARRAIGKMGIE